MITRKISPERSADVFDHAVHAYLRAIVGARAVHVGPFLGSFDDYDAGMFRAYAIPDDDATPTRAHIAELVAVFTDRSRTPRLLAAGFLPERRLLVMSCVPAAVIWPRAAP
jgi:hypothetical protein